MYAAGFRQTVVLISVCLSSLGCSAIRTDEYSIQNVQLVFRHGDRTPIVGLNDPSFPFDTYWPSGRGQLTNLGVLQEYQLGLWFRSRYEDYIPSEYNASYFHMRSSDFDRTLMSAQAFLAGFYPDPNSSLVKYGLAWNPVPVHTILKSNDYILSQAKCPCLTIIQDVQMDLPKSLEFEKKHSSLFRLIQENTAYKISDRYNIWEVYDAITSMQAHEYTLPSWLTSEIVAEIQLVEEYYWRARYLSTNELIRLEIGVFLYRLVEHIDAVIENTAPAALAKQHVLAYSAHDSVISYLLRAWGAFHSMVPFSAAISFELLDLPNEDFRLRFLYKAGYSDDKGTYLQLPSCNSTPAEMGCPLTSVKRYLKTYIVNPEDIEAYCSKDSYNEDPSDPKCNKDSSNGLTTLIIVALSIAAIIALILIVCTVYLVRRRRYVV